MPAVHVVVFPPREHHAQGGGKDYALRHVIVTECVCQIGEEVLFLVHDMANELFFRVQSKVSVEGGGRPPCVFLNGFVAEALRNDEIPATLDCPPTCQTFCKSDAGGLASPVFPSTFWSRHAANRPGYRNHWPQT
jgi:hypothetical protein